MSIGCHINFTEILINFFICTKIALYKQTLKGKKRQKLFDFQAVFLLEMDSCSLFELFPFSPYLLS